MRSESCAFIWQPNVSIRYFRATLLHGPFPAVGTFAFAFRSPFAFRLDPVGAAQRQHFTGGSTQSGGDLFSTEHTPDLVDPGAVIEAGDRGAGASLLDPLHDLEVRVGVGGD